MALVASPRATAASTAGAVPRAEVFAVSFRISGRLGWTNPDIARFLTGAGLDLLDSSTGLAPRALRDLKAGQAAGRFTIPEAGIALSAVAGALLGLLRLASATAPPRHRQLVGNSSRPSDSPG